MHVLLKCGRYIILLLLSAELSGQAAQRQVILAETNAPYGFYEYLPNAYLESTDDFPLIIYLHGRGETGNGGADLSKVKENGPPRLIEEGKDFPAVILSPQSAGDWDVDSLDAFVEWAFQNYKADTARLYLTGISMGGAGVWLYAATYPEKPRAIVPISGDAKVTNPENLVDMAVWAFHNEGDHVVEVELTYGWINGIKDAGGYPKVTIYEKSGHDAWTDTYNSEAMWEWMFAQKPEPPPLQTSGSLKPSKVYPNPFSDELILDHPDRIISARLYNIKGRKVAEWSAIAQKGTKCFLTMKSDVLPGTYLLEVTSARGLQRYKVIKQ